LFTPRQRAISRATDGFSVKTTFIGTDTRSLSIHFY
jgi:hypothetical protein